MQPGLASGLWPSPSLAQKIGWRLWEGHSDPIHPAWLPEQGWSGYRPVGSTHGASCRLQLPPSTPGFRLRARSGNSP